MHCDHCGHGPFRDNRHLWKHKRESTCSLARPQGTARVDLPDGHSQDDCTHHDHDDDMPVDSFQCQGDCACDDHDDDDYDPEHRLSSSRHGRGLTITDTGKAILRFLATTHKGLGMSQNQAEDVLSLCRHYGGSSRLLPSYQSCRKYAVESHTRLFGPQPTCTTTWTIPEDVRLLLERKRARGALKSAYREGASFLDMRRDRDRPLGLVFTVKAPRPAS